MSLHAHNVYWTGCYRSGLDLGTEDSVAHPAKMAWGLAFRTFQHLRELGLLGDGDTVLDPMAGTGRTNVVAGALGHPSISVELETQFMEFQKGMEEARQRRPGLKPPWTRLQGDARGLTGLLDEAGLVGVLSPPYYKGRDRAGDPIGSRRRSAARNNYGTAPGQIGNLPDRGLAAIDGITSLDAPSYDNRLSDADDRAFMDADGEHTRPPTSYGHSGGNIGNLRAVGVTSPPFMNSHAAQGKKNDPAYWDRVGGIRHSQSVDYDEKLPFEQRGFLMGEEEYKHYKATTNIGNFTIPDTYAAAMLQVYREMARCCRVAVITTKNPTRAGRIHPLHRITARLLREAGFRIVDYHRAVLFDVAEQADMFGETKQRVNGRLSFFKRLSLNKGQPVARWEDVLIAVREKDESHETTLGRD